MKWKVSISELRLVCAALVNAARDDKQFRAIRDRALATLQYEQERKSLLRQRQLGLKEAAAAEARRHFQRTGNGI